MSKLVFFPFNFHDKPALKDGVILNLLTYSTQYLSQMEINGNISYFMQFSVRQ